MREACVLVDFEDRPIHWNLPDDRSSVYIPDSRTFWDVIWESRSCVKGIAHSHPGVGLPSPSSEDITTFDAIEDGLGIRLNWWITSSSHLVVCRWESKFKYCVSGDSGLYQEWLPKLREISDYKGR